MDQAGSKFGKIFNAPRWPWWGLVLAGMLGGLCYLPSVGAGFDFADDGVFAYPQPCSSWYEFHSVVWDKAVEEFRGKGPFRPVAWWFWQGEAEWFADHPLAWRLFRVAWAGLACAVFLWLLQDLGIRPAIACLVVGLAQLNPYRGEIWIALTHCEGLAMPFALGSLLCAWRAGPASRPWAWDLAGMVCALLAIGCKNVFLAVVPAQMYLRLVSGGIPLWQGIQQHGWRALLLSLVSLFPITHFVLFKTQAIAQPYQLGWDWWHVLGQVRSMGGAMSVDYLAAVLLVGTVALLWTPQARKEFRQVAARYRPILGAGLLLFVLGVGVYSPLLGLAGRYTVPGVWGLDLVLAVFFTALFGLPGTVWKRAAGVALAGGAAALLVACLGRQDKNAARITLLWNVLEYVEQIAPPTSQVAWAGVDWSQRTADDLELGEGFHFHLHLQGRGRNAVHVVTYEVASRQQLHAGASTQWLLSGSCQPPEKGAWTLVKEFRRPYWLGRRDFSCYLWFRNPDQPAEGQDLK